MNNTLKRLTLLTLLFLFRMASLLIAQGYQENPVIPGFNPDPSICRVGDDYYLVTSTFEYFPGVPVYHSRDLVHWEIIGHALSRPSQLDLDSIECSNGIYAPTIRHHNGIFYIITTLVGQQKSPRNRNFIVTSENPAGPWSEPHWLGDVPGIDPSLFFDDDGKVYYSGNDAPVRKLWDKHRLIWLQEIDILHWKLTGERKTILDAAPYYKAGGLDGGIESGVNNFEASHLYKKDGIYYLVIAQGGTSHNHAVSIWKSKLAFGPYEPNPVNPILTHRDLPKTHPVTSTGHADFIQSAAGDWWVVYLAKRPYGGDYHVLGRETFLSPVDWKGEWPVVNPAGPVGRCAVTNKSIDTGALKFSKNIRRDEFDSETLNGDYLFVRTPREQWWSLTERKNYLRLKLRPDRIEDKSQPSFVGIRQKHPVMQVSAKMEFTPQSDNEEAGFVVVRDRQHYWKFTIGRVDGVQNISLKQMDKDGGMETVLSQAGCNGNYIFLRIESRGLLYSFAYSADGKSWVYLKTEVNGSFLGEPGAGRFTGTCIGLYASANKNTSQTFADFDWYEY